MEESISRRDSVSEEAAVINKNKARPSSFALLFLFQLLGLVLELCLLFFPCILSVFSLGPDLGCCLGLRHSQLDVLVGRHLLHPRQR